MYDYTSANDLVKWAEEQYKKKNRYKLGGIGRYTKDGTRQFDCCGLYKCFMWHDYHTKNAKFYGKTQKDLNCEGLLAEAKEKGPIKTIPEIPGVLVYMKGHMGIYIGEGKVLEATAKKYNGKYGKIYKTYFKNKKKGCDGKRNTWTHWFKSPYLQYKKPKTRIYFKEGDTDPFIGEVASFMRQTFPLYTKKQALGDYFGPYIKASITEFQKRSKIKISQAIDEETLKELTKYGFKKSIVQQM